MELTLSHTSALELLRAARVAAGEDGLSLEGTTLVAPALELGQTWTSPYVARLKRELGLPERPPLDVLVPNGKARIHNPAVANHVWGTSAPGFDFLKLGDTGIAIPCPEVLLSQMAEVVDLPELVAIGHELCGRYTLRPSSSSLPAVTDIPPLTSQGQIRELLKRAKGLRGRRALRFAVPRIQDGSLSPQETCLSTMAQLPLGRYGYEMGKVDLNETLRPPKGSENLIKASYRIPDLLFRDTRVGINYDGQGHLELGEVVRAARAAGAEPSSLARQKALEVAIESTWNDVAADKQRDRDLMAMGYEVLAVTKHDLGTIDALDLVMRQVMALIEATTSRDLSLQSEALDDAELKAGREKVLRKLRNL